MAEKEFDFKAFDERLRTLENNNQELSNKLNETTEKLEEATETNKSLTDKINKLQGKNELGEDEVYSDERKPADRLTIACINGAPIIDMRLDNKIKLDANNNETIVGTVAICKTADGKSHEISYGNDRNPDDYINLERKTFELTDFVPNDLTGASKVIQGKIVKDYGVVSQIDRSEGVPKNTGVKVKQVARVDDREYTILYNNKKVVLHHTKIYS